METWRLPILRDWRYTLDCSPATRGVRSSTLTSMSAVCLLPKRFERICPILTRNLDRAECVASFVGVRASPSAAGTGPTADMVVSVEDTDEAAGIVTSARHVGHCTLSA